VTIVSRSFTDCAWETTFIKFLGLHFTVFLRLLVRHVWPFVAIDFGQELWLIDFSVNFNYFGPCTAVVKLFEYVSLEFPPWIFSILDSCVKIFKQVECHSSCSTNIIRAMKLFIMTVKLLVFVSLEHVMPVFLLHSFFQFFFASVLRCIACNNSGVELVKIWLITAFFMYIWQCEVEIETLMLLH